MAKIALFTDWFPPAFLAGGPVQSCDNFVHAMQGAYDIEVYTQDRDLHQSQPLTGIASDQWQIYLKRVRVLYASPEKLRTLLWLNRIHQIEADYLYFNSLFSFKFTILPIFYFLFIKRSKAKLILAPRGMVKASALAYKPLKKRVFIYFMRISGVANRLFYHATDSQEHNDIQRRLGVPAFRIFTLPNFPPGKQSPYQPILKTPQELKIVYIARIHPIKNLVHLLRALQSLPASIRCELNIYGHEEDPAYWKNCQDQINLLGDHISVTKQGPIPHHEVERTIQQNHLYVLPTEGENFGHGIFEAFLAGRPVLISDQTPWRELAVKHIGYDLPLNDPFQFAQIILTFASMGQEVYNQYSKASWEFASAYIEQSALKGQYYSLFS